MRNHFLKKSNSLTFNRISVGIIALNILCSNAQALHNIKAQVSVVSIA